MEEKEKGRHGKGGGKESLEEKGGKGKGGNNLPHGRLKTLAALVFVLSVNVLEIG